MVLRRAADQRRAADIDVLDAVVVIGALGDGRLERIEIDDQQIDRRDAVLGGLRIVLCVAAYGQQPAMHLRMQRLHAPVHHLGKAGEVGHVLDGKPRGPQGSGRAAGGDQLDAHIRQGGGERDETRLVRYRKQRTTNARNAGHLGLFLGHERGDPIDFRFAVGDAA